MKTLLILRHAKSSWKYPELPDHDRPLKKRGRRDAPKMGHLAGDHDLLPDLIISSTAKRARQTAKTFARAGGFTGKIKLTRTLYHAAPGACLEILRDLPEKVQRVLIVGHNPGLEELLEVLTGDWERLNTAALAQIALPIADWSELHNGVTGALVNLWRPRDLD